MGRCYNIVKVDIDIPYKLFKNIFLDHYVESISIVYKALGYNIQSIRIYPSPSLNTHVYIEIDKCVEFPKLVILQFLACDDHRRILHNIKRFIAFNDPMDRLYPP